jgi:hypothetical protein
VDDELTAGGGLLPFARVRDVARDYGEARVSLQVDAADVPPFGAQALAEDASDEPQRSGDERGALGHQRALIASRSAS